MVPSSSSGDSDVGRSSGTPVLLATLVWSLSLVLMPWMMPARTAARLQALPISPSTGFWAIAAVTVLCAWVARGDARRSWTVLALSLLATAWYFMTLR